MFFGQKVYFNNKPLILTNDRENFLREQPLAAGYLSFTGAFPRHYRLAFDHLMKPASLGALIEDVSPRALIEELHAFYEPVDAGGGVVLNENGDVLMIYRRGKWDLPKGKRDDGEDIAVCAVREVSEETGLSHITLGDKICDTYHVYSQNGQSLLKRTAWYKMTASSSESLSPQAEENILEARWIPVKDLAPIVFKSYEAIREVLSNTGIKW